MMKETFQTASSSNVNVEWTRKLSSLTLRQAHSASGYLDEPGFAFTEVSVKNSQRQ